VPQGRVLENLAPLRRLALGRPLAAARAADRLVVVLGLAHDLLGLDGLVLRGHFLLHRLLPPDLAHLREHGLQVNGQ
jgi:hypothetical protein